MSEGAANDGAALIGLDWSTSNLRVIRIAECGALLATRSDPCGAGGLDDDGFLGVLAEAAAEWLEDGLSILACGMAGASNGT